jgi:hypothetical protein
MRRRFRAVFQPEKDDVFLFVEEKEGHLKN